MLELYFVYVYNNLWMQFESIAANINANIFLLQMKQKTFVHEQNVEGIVNMKISGKMFLSHLLFWLGTGNAEESSRLQFKIHRLFIYWILTDRKKVGDRAAFKKHKYLQRIGKVQGY